MKWNHTRIHEELLYFHFTVKENNNCRSSVFLWIRRKKVLNEYPISKTERIKRTQKISQEIIWKHTHIHPDKENEQNEHQFKERKSDDYFRKNAKQTWRDVEQKRLSFGVNFSHLKDKCCFVPKQHQQEQHRNRQQKVVYHTSSTLVPFC